MSKVAFLFPGQGAQYIGMAKEFYDSYESAREVFREASEASGVDLVALCMEENDRINLTEYTQVAILTASVAMLRVIEEQGIQADVTAGLSLGEYCALVASGVLNVGDAAKLVRKRGLLMQEAVPQGVGTMAAVLGMEAAAISEVLDKTAAVTNGVPRVQIANYNCPGQIVITGYTEDVRKACEDLKAAGARRAMELNVSGPFHSSLLVGAGEELGRELTSVTLGELAIPYYPNVTATVNADTSTIKELLTRQVSSSVRWQQTMEQMITDGVDTMIEIGPGKTLSGFMRKIDKEIKMLHIEKPENLEELRELNR